MGLRKAIVERNCVSLSDSVAKKFQGGHTLSGMTEVLKVDRFKKQVQWTVEDLNKILAKEHPKPKERKQFMNALLNWKKLTDFQIEAVRRVYQELYGKLPELEASS